MLIFILVAHFSVLILTIATDICINGMMMQSAAKELCLPYQTADCTLKCDYLFKSIRFAAFSCSILVLMLLLLRSVYNICKFDGRFMVRLISTAMLTYCLCYAASQQTHCIQFLFLYFFKFYLCI